MTHSKYLIIKECSIRMQVNKQKDEANMTKRMKRWLWNVGLLSYLLGITWACGFFNFTNLKVFQYLFVSLNASTGIFILIFDLASYRSKREQKRLRSKKKSMTTTSTKMSNYEGFRRQTLQNPTDVLRAISQ